MTYIFLFFNYVLLDCYICESNIFLNNFSIQNFIMYKFQVRKKGSILSSLNFQKISDERIFFEIMKHIMFERKLIC